MSDLSQSAAPQPQPPNPPRRFRWSRLVLVVSLGLNLLVAGLVVGSFAGKERRGPPPAALSGRDMGYGPYIGALDREARVAASKDLRAQLPSWRNLKAERAAHFRAVVAALRADPYDPDALAALMAQQRDMLARGQIAGAQTLLTQIDAMDASRRAAYADRLEAFLERGPKSHEGREGGRNAPDGAPRPPRQ